ncbi:hypothetical protein O6H91_02G097100 [Diphasiastrum complanatum]|uniref:Uncharacterized protein n=1 Tax=Diphasiastrum complanatum TaxID=34168 RepID=A0ACC2EIM6_DIPCM|nr:hypothetical protein O6H91_02G097100 [Diphasiastrum complanatum]
MALLLACLVFTGFLLLARFMRHTWASRRYLRLPPGSMGWPYFGETLQLYTQNPNMFFSAKQKRYGDIFKTHVLGHPSIMIASPEAAKFILVSHAHLFKATFPSSKEGIIGPRALFFHEGEYHKRLRKLVQSSFLPEAIRGMVSDIEALALRVLDSWDGQTVNTFEEMKKFSFDVGLLEIFGNHKGLNKHDLKCAYHTMEKGYNCFPIDFPGFTFNKAMKARRHLSAIVSKIIAQRRQHKQLCKDLLGTLMDSNNEACRKLTDEQIADNVIGVIFAAQDTTASVLTWLVKFLKENPTLLEAVTAEHDIIRQRKSIDDKSLTWDDTRKMPLTSRVIQETLRVSTILSFTFREAVEDVEYKGYLIPKGWKVMPLFRNIHHSPELFPDPHKFDPSRFEKPPKPNTFMPFGNGVHSCPGSELAKLEMLILVHHLTTKFRWEFVGPLNGIQYGPFPLPKHGLPISVSRK